jgi:hypothetical protein
MPDGLASDARSIPPERLIEVTIGLWPDDEPPGQRPTRLAAAIVRALHAEGYAITEASGTN